MSAYRAVPELTASNTFPHLHFCLLFFNLQGEFVDDGTETHFTLGDHNCCVKAVSSGKRRDGIIHTLLVDGTEIAECTEGLCE